MASLGVSFRRNQSICRRILVARAQIGPCVDRHAGAVDLPEAVGLGVGVADGDVADRLHTVRNLAPVLAILEPRSKVTSSNFALAIATRRRPPDAPLLGGDEL